VKVVETLLRQPKNRGCVLDLLAALISANTERQKMRPDINKCSTTGLVLNLAQVRG
jgi:hypothetical protein